MCESDPASFLVNSTKFSLELLSTQSAMFFVAAGSLLFPSRWLQLQIFVAVGPQATNLPFFFFPVSAASSSSSSP